MPGPYYRTRRLGLTAAVNTPTPVNVDLDGNTSNIVVPANTTKITQIISSIGASIVAVASAGVTIGIRLAGDGMKDGQQDITIGALREDTTSTAGAKLYQPFVLETDLNVAAPNQITMAVSIGGVDPGTPEVEVTLVFE